MSQRKTIRSAPGPRGSLACRAHVATAATADIRRLRRRVTEIIWARLPIEGMLWMENLVHVLHGKESIIGVNGTRDQKRLRAVLNVGFTAAVRKYCPVFLKAAQTVTEHLDNSSSMSINVVPLLSNATLGAVWRAEIYLPTQPFKTVRRVKMLPDQIGNQVIRDNREAVRQGLEINTNLYGQLYIHYPVCWARYYGSAVPEAQLQWAPNRLELARNLTLQNESGRNPLGSWDCKGRHVQYDSLPLLNAFIKEVLKMYPAEAFSERVAVPDTVIPLTASIATTPGEHISEICISKGQIVIFGLGSSHWRHASSTSSSSSLRVHFGLDWSRAGVLTHTSLTGPAGFTKRHPREKLSIPVPSCREATPRAHWQGRCSFFSATAGTVSVTVAQRGNKKIIFEASQPQFKEPACKSSLEQAFWATQRAARDDIRDGFLSLPPVQR
ncbi:hypothetical protein B0H19DRAFT_1064205 [Mycena capillaripes]|nr:hypothetical protein B0H19DRAFT_1064205 [Mycena capillaripes]